MSNKIRLIYNGETLESGPLPSGGGGGVTYVDFTWDDWGEESERLVSSIPLFEIAQLIRDGVEVKGTIDTFEYSIHSYEIYLDSDTGDYEEVYITFVRGGHEGYPLYIYGYNDVYSTEGEDEWTLTFEEDEILHFFESYLNNRIPISIEGGGIDLPNQEFEIFSRWWDPYDMISRPIELILDESFAYHFSLINITDTDFIFKGILFDPAVSSSAEYICTIGYTFELDEETGEDYIELDEMGSIVPVPESNSEIIQFNFTSSGSTITTDVTIEEIFVAYNEGKVCFACIDGGVTLPLTICTDQEEYPVVGFSGILTNGEENTVVLLAGAIPEEEDVWTIAMTPIGGGGEDKVAIFNFEIDDEEGNVTTDVTINEILSAIQDGKVCFANVNDGTVMLPLTYFMSSISLSTVTFSAVVNFYENNLLFNLIGGTNLSEDVWTAAITPIGGGTEVEEFTEEEIDEIWDEVMG